MCKLLSYKCYIFVIIVMLGVVTNGFADTLVETFGSISNGNIPSIQKPEFHFWTDDGTRNFYKGGNDFVYSSSDWHGSEGFLTCDLHKAEILTPENNITAISCDVMMKWGDNSSQKLKFALKIDNTDGNGYIGEITRNGIVTIYRLDANGTKRILLQRLRTGKTGNKRHIQLSVADGIVGLSSDLGEILTIKDSTYSKFSNVGFGGTVWKEEIQLQNIAVAVPAQKSHNDIIYFRDDNTSKFNVSIDTPIGNYYSKDEAIRFTWNINPFDKIVKPIDCNITFSGIISDYWGNKVKDLNPVTEKMSGKLKYTFSPKTFKIARYGWYELNGTLEINNKKHDIRIPFAVMEPAYKKGYTDQEIMGMGIYLYNRFSPKNKWKYFEWDDIAKLCREIGVSYSREEYNSSWQPEFKVYNWGNIDKSVSVLKKNHIKIIGLLTYTAKWNYTHFKDALFTPESRQFWAENNVAPIVEHLKDYVRYFTVWNEPNAFWNDDPSKARGFARSIGSPANYADLCKKTYVAIKKVDRNIQSIPSLASCNLAGDVTRLYDLGVKPYMDALDVHAYGGTLNHLINTRKIMSKHGDANKDIWVTEVGITGNKTHLPSLRTQARYLANVYITSRSVPHIRSVLWYNFRDDSMTNPGGMYGIVTPYFRPKPSFVAFNTISSVMKQSRFVKKTKQGMVHYYLFMRNDGIPLNVIWSENEKGNIIFETKDVSLKSINIMGEIKYLTSHNGKLNVTASPDPLFIVGNIKLADSLGINLKPQVGPSLKVSLSAKNLKDKTPHVIDISAKIKNVRNKKVVYYNSNTKRIVLASGQETNLNFALTVPVLHNTYNASVKVVCDGSILRKSEKVTFTPAAKFDAVPLTTPLSELKNRYVFSVNKGWKGDKSNWSGKDDLSLRISFGWTDENLIVMVDVNDDIHIKGHKDSIWSTDSIQVSIDPLDLKTQSALMWEYNCGDDISKGPVVNEEFNRLGLPTTAEIKIKRENKVTSYRLLVPWEELAIKPYDGRVVAVSILVNDNDGKGRSGWIEWGGGIAYFKNPAFYKEIILTAGSGNE